MNSTRYLPLRLPTSAPLRHRWPVTRQEYFHDDDAPPANSMTPTAFAAVRDDHGRVLLVRRRDSGDRELPGGRVELGKMRPPRQNAKSSRKAASPSK